MALSERITPDKLQRRISGIVTSLRPSNVAFVKILKHLPGPSLPARPALCVAYAYETAVTCKESTPVVF